MIEASQLAVLVAVDQATSLSQAAEFLNITQSAVSQNLKNLESKVGFAVVTRQGKKVVLTPSGKRLAKLSKNYSKRFDDLISELQQEKQRIIGSVAMGTMYGIGKSWIAHRMIEFSANFPDLGVKLTMDFADKLITAFENRELDCLVLPQTLVPAHCESKVLHNENSTLVFPDSPEFNIDTQTDLKQLVEYPVIFFEERDPLFYQWCRQRYGNVPRNIQPRIVVNAFGQILQAVNEGLGIAVIPTHVLRRSYFKNKVKTLGKEMDIQSNVFNFIYHSEDKESLKLDTLYSFLQQEVSRLDL
jgi:DNA-binding transcriptional LysR family regulator